MTNPSVDIIVPVWNNPFETRSCLAAILTYSPEARLIVVDNGSSRETELMLEEFSESLGEQGLFMTCERNIGLIPSINRGLARSDSDYAVLVRPQVTVCNGWLGEMLTCAARPHTGIVSPLFRGKGAPTVARPLSGLSHSETFSLSFATLLLKGEMHRSLGGFDEGMDGGEWCLKDYMRRAEIAGFHTSVTTRPELACSQDTIFGSLERRQEQLRTSTEQYLTRWGVARHYVIYFGKDFPSDDFSSRLETILAAARRGHRFSLLLHHKQFKEFRKRGWNGLHTAISLFPLPMFGAVRTLARQITTLQQSDPDLILVKGSDGVQFPGDGTAISFTRIYPADTNSYAPEPITEPTMEAA